MSKLLQICPDEWELAANELNCPVEDCKFVFKKAPYLKSHLLTRHGIGQAHPVKNDAICQYFCPVIDCNYNIQSRKKRSFTSNRLLKQHYRKVHVVKELSCWKCGAMFSVMSALKRHEDTCGSIYECGVCQMSYSTSESLMVHLLRKHPETHQKYLENKKADTLKEKERIQILNAAKKNEKFPPSEIIPLNVGKIIDLHNCVIISETFHNITGNTGENNFTTNYAITENLIAKSKLQTIKPNSETLQGDCHERIVFNQNEDNNHDGVGQNKTEEKVMQFVTQKPSVNVETMLENTVPFIKEKCNTFKDKNVKVVIKNATGKIKKSKIKSSLQRADRFTQTVVKSVLKTGNEKSTVETQTSLNLTTTVSKPMTKLDKWTSSEFDLSKFSRSLRLKRTFATQTAPKVKKYVDCSVGSDLSINNNNENLKIISDDPLKVPDTLLPVDNCTLSNYGDILHENSIDLESCVEIPFEKCSSIEDNVYLTDKSSIIGDDTINIEFITNEATNSGISPSISIDSFTNFTQTENCMNALETDKKDLFNNQFEDQNGLVNSDEFVGNFASIETQTALDELLYSNILKDGSSDFFKLFSEPNCLSDIQTQTAWTENNWFSENNFTAEEPANKHHLLSDQLISTETQTCDNIFSFTDKLSSQFSDVDDMNLSNSPGISFKETQTCFCFQPDMKYCCGINFENCGNLCSLSSSSLDAQPYCKTEVSNPILVNNSSDGCLSFNAIETQTCFEDCGEVEDDNSKKDELLNKEL